MQIWIKFFFEKKEWSEETRNVRIRTFSALPGQDAAFEPSRVGSGPEGQSRALADLCLSPHSQNNIGNWWKKLRTTVYRGHMNVRTEFGFEAVGT